MSIAQPFSRAEQVRFNLALVVVVLLFNLAGLMVTGLAIYAAGTSPQTAGELDAATESQLLEMRDLARRDSLMRQYVDYMIAVEKVQQSDPQGVDAFNQTYWQQHMSGGLILRLLGLLALFGLLGVTVLVCVLFGLYRLVTGPALARRWQRWQQGVVSPLPIWMLVAGCFCTLVLLMTVRTVLPPSDSLFYGLAIWEATQAVLLAGLLIVAVRVGGLRPQVDFGFQRRPLRGAGRALIAYFALLPLFWGMALGGKVIYQVVDTAAGAPTAAEETGMSIEQIIAPGNDPWGPAVLLVAAVILAPLLEELFFRGFLYGSLRRWMGAPAAVVLSGAIFAGLHPMPNHLPIFFLGMFLAYTYEKTGNLGAAIVVHFTHNLITTLLMGLMLM